MVEQGILFIEEKKLNKAIVNVSSVPQRSPFRYPGGKTWLIPTIRKWMQQSQNSPDLLIEPFAGGGIVSLTAAFESLAKGIIMLEKDEEVAAVWETIFTDQNLWLAEKILHFELNHENIQTELQRIDKQVRDTALCTILKNRTYHGGILAKGSGFLKSGENGKGISSRWYPKTLHDRLRAINTIRNKISFIKGDAFEFLENNLERDAYFFIDPPYSIAGKRLYTHYEINNDNLMHLVSKLKGKFLLTYDDTTEIRKTAEKYNLQYTCIPMKTTMHKEKYELLISDNLDWI